MHRFYLPPDLCQGDVFALSESDAHHAATVLRLQPGELVCILNGAGERIHALITRLQKRSVEVQRQKIECVPKPATPIALFTAVTKPKAMDWMLQKATELGVSAIHPVVTERCVSRPAPGDAESKRTGWQATVIEAAKQSNAAWIPQVHPPQSFAAALKDFRPEDWSVVAALTKETRTVDASLAAWIQGRARFPETASIWTGPEGDFTPVEYHALSEAGVGAITLGDQILRAETAALTAIALVHHELRRQRPGS